MRGFQIDAPYFRAYPADDVLHIEDNPTGLSLMVGFNKREKNY